MKALSIAAAIALSLSACATAPPEATPQEKAEVVISNIDFAYMPVRAAGSLCASGLLCSDEAVQTIVGKALPILDEAYTSGVAFIRANADDATAIAARKKAILDAIALVAKALQSYGVKL